MTILTRPRLGKKNWIGLSTLYKREIYRFFKIYIQTIFAPVITTLVFFIIFSLAIGRLRDNINGIDFMEFLAPGLIMMAIIQNSFTNASSSIMAAKMQNNIIDTLMPPLTAGELVIAYTAGGITRGITVGIAVSLVLAFFVETKIYNLIVIIYFAFATSMMMSLLGIIGGIWADRHDHMTVINSFIITPLSFLSGTFYSIDSLPEQIRSFALFNPFFYAIDGMRSGFIGHSDGPILIGVLILFFLNLLLWFIAYKFFATGYKLRI